MLTITQPYRIRSTNRTLYGDTILCSSPQLWRLPPIREPKFSTDTPLMAQVFFTVAVALAG